ncbi:MAG TPA: tetratricopeptide repeat protein [Longimicrobiaceae bacterium]|nr:tetratricopeptide repeat protein [Longimicrobiaceae bacterium]
MSMTRGVVLAACVAAVSAACAAGAAGGAKPVTSASGIPDVTCPGVAPTAATRTAQTALNRTLIPGMRAETAAPFYQQALTAVQPEMDNPYNAFIAGQAYAGLGQYARADSAFTRTTRACAAFGTEVGTERSRAYGMAFNAGVAALNAGDTATAITRFTQAIAVNPGQSDALFNLGLLYSNTGDLGHAVQYYRQALAAVGTAADTSAVETRSNVMMGLLAAGTTYFQKDQFAQSADVFRTITAADGNNRDAWYNLGLALYKQNRWADLVPVAQRIVQIDPLNYNARIILFNAYKGLADASSARVNPDRQRALDALRAADGLPVQVEGVRVENTGGTARVTGTIVGATTPAGRPVSLEFTLYGATGRLGSQTVTVTAPAKDAKANFQLSLPTNVPATSFSYRIAP